MGRPIRVQFPGACYFITLQGNNRQDIFLGNQDRRQFLSLLRAYRERYQLQVYAFCLMDSSVQLLLETREANLSRVMQGFNTVYTKYFNRIHNTTGHVLQGRYKALLVEKEGHLLDLTMHVHLAPVRAGLKEKPWRYLWSSCAAYVESETKEPLVDSEPVLRRFGKMRLKQSVKYLQLLKERLKAGSEGPPIRGSVIGGPEFAASVAAAPAPKAPSSEEVVERILAETLAKGVDRQHLFSRSQWREVASVRKEAIYRIWKEARLGVTEISRMFHRTPSAISQLIRSIELSKPPKAAV